MEVLIANPAFVNRLNISAIYVENIIAPSSYFLENQPLLKYQNDPEIHIQTGTKSDVSLLRFIGAINATGVITSASDRRFKKDLTSLDGSLKKILSLRGVVFSWRDKNFGKGKQIGFIAQELEEF
jgi:hypothetical protein